MSTQVQSLAWELPYATGVALKKQKKKKKKKKERENEDGKYFWVTLSGNSRCKEWKEISILTPFQWEQKPGHFRL